MPGKMIPIVVIALLMLAGCEETATETAEDIAEAREDAAQNNIAIREDSNQTINDAQRDVVDARQEFARTDQAAQAELSEAEAEALTMTAHANFDVAEAAAEGRNDVAKERCDALSGAARDLCLSNAEMALATALAEATAIRDTTLLAAERHE